jgi:peptidoglycan hydrolase-like protein with peptidoglycan-binding domain
MSHHSGFYHGLSTAALSGPVLYPWAEGPAVVELQELLCAHGYKLKIDGDYGGRTEAAVKLFQRGHGLRIDGVIGPKTWAMLKTTVQPGTRILKRGSTGADVAEMQGLLQVCSYPVHRNGVFDEETEQAILAFQGRHRLQTTGRVDRVTWIVLRGNTSALPTPPQQPSWFLNIRKWW